MRARTPRGKTTGHGSTCIESQLCAECRQLREWANALDGVKLVPVGCGAKLAKGQWWTFCGETDMGQTPPVLCTECGGEFKRAE
jgi:hypothetical protein